MPADRPRRTRRRRFSTPGTVIPATWTSNVSGRPPGDPLGPAPKRPKMAGFGSVEKMAGRTGLKILGGFVYEEFEAALQGQLGMRTWREMIHNDATVGALLFVIEQLTRRVSWRIDPGDDSAEAKEYAEFVDGCFKDMNASWPDTLVEIESCLGYGFDVHEILYKERRGYHPDPDRSSVYNDGRIGWARWAQRAQDAVWRWDFDEASDKTVGFWQRPPPTYQEFYVPLWKCLHFRVRGQKTNPEGVSLLRNAWRAWKFKNNLETLEAIGMERDLAGLPVLYVPPEILDPDNAESVAQATALKRMLRNIRRDENEAIILPLEYDAESGQPTIKLELLASGGQRQINVSDAIARWDMRIAMAVAAQFLFLGHQGKGSAGALSENQSDLFTTALEAWLDQIADTISVQGIRPLCQLNGMTKAPHPRMAHGDVRDLPLDEVATFFQKLGLSGAPIWQGDNAGTAIRELFRAARLPLPDPKSIEQSLDEQDQMAQEKHDAAIDSAKQQAVADAGGAAKPGPNPGGRTGTRPAQPASADGAAKPHGQAGSSRARQQTGGTNPKHATEGGDE